MSRLVQFTKSLFNPRSDLSRLSSASADGLELPAMAGSRLKLHHITSNTPLIFGGLIVLALFLIVLFGPLWAPVNPYIAGRHVVPHFDSQTGVWIDPPLNPSAEYPLGTDELGNDILSMLLYGARNTLIAAAFVTMARVILGLFLGSLAGWHENQGIDRLIMGSSGVIMAVPMLISAMILIYALDIRRGLPVFIIALTVIGWTEIAQYMRSEILIIRKMPYIEGARAVGSNERGMVVRHVLPNLLPQLLVIIFLEFGAVLLLMGGLAFIGVFIGGGTSTVAGDDTIALSTQVVADVPEWGAMLAGGYRWFTSKPFIVFPPALAFFIAIIGFNTFGEGLRRLIARTHVNTSFLLKKRMLLVVAAVIAATIYIIGNTGPAPWLAKMANAFSAGGAYEQAQTLSQMEGRAPGGESHAEAAAYIAQQFEQFGLLPGWKSSQYIYPMPMTLTTPTRQPQLQLLDQEGSILLDFQHQLDFGFMIEGHGGSGQARAPLTFVGFKPGAPPPAWQDYQGLDLNGRIVVLHRGNAPPDFPIEAQLRGALGIIWISTPGQKIKSQTQLAPPEADHMLTPQLPIMRITSEAGQQLLENMGLSEAQLMQPADAAQSGPGWFTHDSDQGLINMAVELSPPQEQTVPTVLGYRSGSDLSLAGELVIIFANFDGLGRDPDGTLFPAANHNASGAAVLLEIARLWQEQDLDPRRPVLFVAWGSGTLQHPAAAQFIDDQTSYLHLPTTERLQPRAVFQLDYAGSGAEEIFIHPRSNNILAQLISETAAELDLPVAGIGDDQRDADPRYEILDTRSATVYLAWNDAPLPPDQDSFQNLDAEKLRSYGELLALSLAKVVRQSRY